MIREQGNMRSLSPPTESPAPIKPHQLSPDADFDTVSEVEMTRERPGTS